jgi:hypothetical protein
MTKTKEKLKRDWGFCIFRMNLSLRSKGTKNQFFIAPFLWPLFLIWIPIWSFLVVFSDFWLGFEECLDFLRHSSSRKRVSRPTKHMSVSNNQRNTSLTRVKSTHQRAIVRGPPSWILRSDLIHMMWKEFEGNRFDPVDSHLWRAFTKVIAWQALWLCLSWTSASNLAIWKGFFSPKKYFLIKFRILKRI